MAEPRKTTNRLKSTTRFKGSISDVCYHWIRQDMKEGRSDNGHFSFDGPRLYSYDTQVAELHPVKDGKVALFTNQHSFDGHVNTTNGKHIGPAWNVCYHGGEPRWSTAAAPSVHAAKGIFHVPDFRLAFKHEMNLEHFIEQYKLACDVIAKARVSQPVNHWIASTPSAVLRQIDEYCAVFGIDKPKGIYEDWMTDAYAKWEARHAVYNSPKEVEKRKRKEARRMLRDLCLGKVNP